MQSPSESCADAWTHGAHWLARGNTENAADWFERAVGHDPQEADAWLGLHAAGRNQAEALESMLVHRERLGSLRTRLGLQFESRFHIGLYVTFRLSSAGDLWLAKTAALITDGEYGAAAMRLAEASSDDELVRFLRTRNAFNQQEWEEVVKHSRQIEDGFLFDESQLYTALALTRLGMQYEALDMLERLPTTLDGGGAFEGEVAFARGLAWEGIGDEEQAAKAFQRAYRCAPETPIFAERARPEGAKAPEAATASGPVDGTASEGSDGDGPAAEDREALLEEGLGELNVLIGLDPVKAQVRSLTAQIRMAALKEARGLPAPTRPNHFVFAGPPGTGKTTVARIMGRILAGMGLLDHGSVVEVQRGDLVGEYLGHTAAKTRKRIDEAMGGILFVDEAYALSNQGYAGGRDAFGDEALQELLTAAENRRTELVIILAGYGEEMAGLLQTNPGLRSRFGVTVDFPSYSAAELVAIAGTVFEAGGDLRTEGADLAIAACFEAAVGAGSIDDLGNGRFARELCRKAAACRDVRLLEGVEAPENLTTEEMLTVTADDVFTACAELVPGLDPVANLQDLEP
jgi:type VII secretion ATPase EccA